MPKSYCAVYIHVVFSTKVRAPQIDASLEERLYPYIGGIVRELGGKLLRGNGTADHVHLLISMPANVSTAWMVKTVKASSTRWIHETFAERDRFEWQRGYAAFSVSQSALETVARYIDRQKSHHAKRA
jgi:REP element-mobilizing transposase RayT